MLKFCSDWLIFYESQRQKCQADIQEKLSISDVNAFYYAITMKMSLIEQHKKLSKPKHLTGKPN